MQSNNFRGYSSNNRYNNSNQNQGGGFQVFNQFNYQRNPNQNNLLFSNSNSNHPFGNSLQNSNNFPVRINPLSSFQMSNSMGQPIRPNIPKKRLYVKLTQEEKGYFSNLFQLVDSQGMGKLKNKEAANFMKKSGLNKNILKNIFLIAQPKSKQYLERDEFYVALRLIALAQNNMPFNEQAIILNKPIPPLPNFNLKKDFLADGDTSFELKDDEKVKYKRIFDINKDGNNDNISAKKAIQMWRSTGVSDNVIQKIADVLKPNETRGFLNLREFQVATHFINLSDRHEIPTQLPANLKKYLGRNDISNNILNFNNIGNKQINNNMNNNQQLTIHYGNNIFSNKNYNNNNNFNNNNFINNNTFNNNNFNNNNLNQNLVASNQNPNTIDELYQKNELLNNKINDARNKLNNILKEIDDMQNEQMNIKNQINIIKGNNMNISSNMPNININNNTNNININNNTNNINNNENNNYNFNLNQSGIGPSKNIIDFNPVNLPQNKKDNQNEEYEKLKQKKNALLDLMNKMDFNKLIISNNNNQNAEDKTHLKNADDKDKNDPHPDNDIIHNNIPPLDQFSKANTNKFDDKLLESQAFAPEKLEKIVMEEMSGADDFNINFEQEYNKAHNEKKDEINFSVDSPIENKKFNFDNKFSNISLGSEIKKIEQNDYPNLDETNNKINYNDSKMFHFELGDDSIKKSERKQSADKDTFNFNTTVNQKEGDEWDF